LTTLTAYLSTCGLWSVL